MGIRAAHSSSSSTDSSNHPDHHLPKPAGSSSSSSSLSQQIKGNYSNSQWTQCHGSHSGRRTDLSTDLRLGLSISPSHQNDLSSTSTPREQALINWPPIKAILRSTLAGKAENRHQYPSLFVKVYMEGIPIGRKLNLFAHDGYDALISTLGLMFKTTILCPDDIHVHSDKYHVLTYEDQEGDWMLVGDVPWEIFLTTVKRLKITRADRC